MMQRVHAPLRGSLIFVMGLGILLGCGTTTGPLPQHSAEVTNRVTIPRAADVFAPFILPMQPQMTVTWQNTDTVAHTMVTTPVHSAFLNPQAFSLVVAPGQSVTLTLTKPGVYDYYDQQAGSWSAFYQRVMPYKGLPKYPMTMEGIIWVQGAIPGLPTTAHNSVVYLRDEIATFVVAVRTGGTVSWQNQDSDPHFFLPVLGWDVPINPIEVGLDNLLGRDKVPPNGQTKSITFTMPGLYYYFCFTHATVDPVLLRAYARPMASEYPIPMDGFVLVTND
jgi:plastocyanin